MELHAAALPEWASKPCIMGIDEAGRGPVLGPMVYGCMYCARSYQNKLSTLNFADSKTLTELKREELFDSLKDDKSLGWAVDIIDPRELSAKMLKKSKINLNEISHDSAIGLIRKISSQGVLLTEDGDLDMETDCVIAYTSDNIWACLSLKVFLDTVGDADKYAAKLSAIFPDIKFVVSKKADSLYPIVSGASIVAKVTRDRALRNWELEETAEELHRDFGSGYPGDPQTKAWLSDHKHPIFGFPTLVRFSWGTCTAYSKDLIEVQWEMDTTEEDGNGRKTKRQMKLVNVDGFAAVERKNEEESEPSRCKFFQARKLQLLHMF